ncbi:phage portal protein [Brucella anthropi]|uniref:Phage portal protein, lambda family n=1 Tax=Brucella anthropi (strain ATCC 49188 / DSM 6882 / CCUG 24695 / JCM 21032 / LMG 3331 / NBRC 15819 / NCTC 12168 / Alc 37) TaxID=439375 RepID=A6WZU6_BRUA4|nr:phage portal protein [Brucella anthropi]ABS14500.1 phage portal protein, lambda family [Brucella anthropi ATCC 49188]AIK44147.1 phage portal, lambda family protein [Brucella anthropi]KAB2739376.1 phage portal protein [Brucella anthropi]KAB2753512.1 phage portal protein [Brucella anthropi]KAB2783582.1 phage portal protein [Brucella anthropi]
MALPFPKLFSRSNKGNPNHKRAVNAASVNWPDDPRVISGSADIRQAGQTVSQRVAGLYVNDPVVRSAVNLVVSQIVGSGVRLNTPDQIVDARFNATRIDPSALMSVTAMQRASIRSWVISGEILGLHRVIDGRYAFQLLDPEQLDRSKNEDLGASGSIVAGVERDGLGVIAGYWILPNSPGDPFARNTQSVRFDAPDVVHVFEHEFPGQVRGISALVATLPVLNNASIAIEARLKQLQVSAMLTAILTSPDGTDAFDGEPNPSLEPGAIIRARPGEQVEVVNGPQSPDFNAFIKVLYRQIAASVGVTYEDLIGDLEGVNYSSFRGGALTARRKAEATRKVTLIEGVLDPVFTRWQAIERLAGRIRADLDHGWIEPSWPEIDRLKEANADISLLNAGLKSRKEIIEARGREYETVQSEFEADKTVKIQGNQQ